MLNTILAAVNIIQMLNTILAAVNKFKSHDVPRLCQVATNTLAAVNKLHFI